MPNIPRGFRNNNPGNIRYGDFARSRGAVGADEGGFAIFSDIDDGLGAMKDLLRIYQDRHGLRTISDIVARWAPASDNNNPAAYAAQVAQLSGLSAFAPVDMSNPTQAQAVIEAMVQVENGQPLSSAPRVPRQPAVPPIRQAFQAFESGRADQLRRRAERTEARARGEQPLREEFAEFRARRARGETPVRDRLVARLGQMFPLLGQRLQNLGGRLNAAGQPQLPPTQVPAPPPSGVSKLPPTPALPPKPPPAPGVGAPKPEDAVGAARRSNFLDFFQLPQPSAGGAAAFAPIPQPMGRAVGEPLAQASSFERRANEALNIGQGFLDFAPTAPGPAEGTPEWFQQFPPAGDPIGDYFRRLFTGDGQPATPAGQAPPQPAAGPPPPPTPLGVRLPQLNPALLPANLLAPRPIGPPPTGLQPFPALTPGNARFGLTPNINLWELF